MGYLCYLLYGAVCGGFGGLTFALTTSESYQIRIPFWKGDKETGCLGHILIGAFSGLLCLSIAISHFNFDVTAALHERAGLFTAEEPLGRAGALILLHTFSISLIGGFLGLKLIVRVADEAINKLDKKIGQFNDEIKEEIDEKDRISTALRHALLARALRTEQDLKGAMREIQNSLEVKPTKFGEFVNALILRSNKKYQDALDALARAVKLPPDSMTKNDASIYWNTACYIGLLDPSRLTDIIENLDKSIKIQPENKDDIKTDDDLKQFLDKEPLKTHFGL